LDLKEAKYNLDNENHGGVQSLTAYKAQQRQTSLTRLGEFTDAGRGEPPKTVANFTWQLQIDSGHTGLP
jgi:hypothetical protein